MIDREKIIKAVEEAFDMYYWSEYGRTSYFDAKEWAENKRDALFLLKEQEAVTAHWSDDTGHWIEGDRNGTDPSKRTTGEMIDTFRCSWCGFYQYWKTPYCPNCGAKMEGR